MHHAVALPMTPLMSSTPREPSLEELLLGADWAIAHGDAGGLSHVIGELSRRVSGALRSELTEFASLCHVSYDLAAERWPAMRDRLRGLAISTN